MHQTILGAIVMCIMNRHVVDKHKETVKYLDLATELQLLWNRRVEIFPLVFDALEASHEKTITNFGHLQLTEVNDDQLQKTVLLRKHLSL